MMKSLAQLRSFVMIATLLIVTGGILLLLRGLLSEEAILPNGPTLTSGVFQSPQRTPTAKATPVPVTLRPTATAAATVAPPPGWPTGEPWPPEVTPQTPTPQATPLPFATPAFAPMPSGIPPEHLQALWYVYWPAQNITPQLALVNLDKEGQRWGHDERMIDIGLQSELPGPSATDLHPSPNHRLLAVDLASGESLGSVLVDLDAETSRPIVANRSDARFLSWMSDSQHVLVQFDQLFTSDPWLVDVESDRYQPIKFPQSDFGDSLLRAAAYSPDGNYLADAVVYPAAYGVRDIEMTEIGLRKGEDSERSIVTQIPGGTHVAEHSLQWSPDGGDIIWIANVIGDTAPSPSNLANSQIQLWTTDLNSGESRMLGLLGEAVEYSHRAVWSPHGRYVAALKVEKAQSGKEETNSIYLFDLETKTAQQLTQSGEQRFSHIGWSPDGQHLVATVAMGDHGEVWMMSLTDSKLHPIAGPTLLNAPSVWLP